MQNIGGHCLCYKLQVIFWPDNIVSLFERFGVKKKFDFLSEDSDSYDFFMTEAILEVYFILTMLHKRKEIKRNPALYPGRFCTSSYHDGVQRQLWGRRS